MFGRRFVTLASASIFLSASLISTAVASEGTSISFGGRVPTVCRVFLTGMAPSVLRRGDNALGQVTELCNNVDGYRLILNHPSGLSNAFVSLGGNRVPLSASATSTVIVDSNHPDFQQRQLELELAEDVDGDAFALSLSAEAKGAVF